MNRYSFRGHGIVAALLALATWLAGAPALAGEPTDFVKKQAQRVDGVLADESDSARRTAAFAEIVDEAFDFRELARRALGTHWKKQSKENREQFLDLLQQLLRANYKNKITGEKMGEDYEIEYLEEKQRDDRAFVATRVKWGDADNQQDPLDFKLMKKEKAWVIYDLVIDDISLEATYRDSYTEIIEDEGWDALIEKMKERIEELRAKAQKKDEGEKEKEESKETTSSKKSAKDEASTNEE